MENRIIEIFDKEPNMAILQIKHHLRKKANLKFIVVTKAKELKIIQLLKKYPVIDIIDIDDLGKMERLKNLRERYNQIKEMEIEESESLNDINFERSISLIHISLLLFLIVLFQLL